MSRAYRLLAISRPRFWIYLIGPYLIALAAAGTVPSLAVIIFGLYLTLPANLLIYGVNDLSDAATDRLNPKKGEYEALLRGSERRWLGRWIYALNVPALLIVPFLPAASWIWIALFVLAGVGYSLRPLRFKTRPGLDAISNILYAAPGFAAYAALTGQQPPLALVLAATCWCAAMHAFSAVPDIAADRASDTPTIATTLGARTTLCVCIGLWLAAAGLAFPYLGASFTSAFGLIYAALGLAGLRTSSTNARLFSIYKAFPLVNAGVGFILFWFLILGKR